MALYVFYYEKKQAALLVFPVIMTTCLLFCSALLINFFSIVFPQFHDSEFNVALPESFSGWIFCILNFACAAVYEEVLYRFYFIDQLQELLSKGIGWKYLWLVCEVLGCAVFALAHLYLGLFPVINAVFGHVILRVCYKKCGNIWAGVTAHFLYNVISLILL